ncbi:DUF2252 domain-containing protein [Microbacterium mangrovi]|uniref:DUF2252 domain-containing protein n=1 Tax=Microbacterium mangrovi TaxID=1348253 RepID=UPI00068BDF99|nr:DUF2252 domain-containing protein [Microbacterium mangrovi]
MAKKTTFGGDAARIAGELYEQGRAARSVVPRSAQAEYTAPAHRDPVGVLRRQHEQRLAWLVPLRVERMSADPFAFYRGTAAIQAGDLAASVSSGADVVLCGDAHIANFGMYRSPEGSMVFDVNDFDEGFVGPWEWDLKRLLASAVLAGRALGMPADKVRGATQLAASHYREALDEALQRSLYARFTTVTSVTDRRKLSPDTELMIKTVLKESAKRTSERVAKRTLERGPDGTLQFIERSPVLSRLEPEARQFVGQVFEDYRASLPPHVALWLSQYTVLDAARRVVGVGSVGTRCFIIALGDASGDILILQLKEATASVLQEFGGRRGTQGYLDQALADGQHGYRVVGCQRILQAVSDQMLGYLAVEGFSFYMRLFRNRNASFEISDMNLPQFEDYVASCATVLARAHARSPKAGFAAGYMGNGDSFLRAVTEWAHQYANQAETDYAVFLEAARDGAFAQIETP